MLNPQFLDRGPVFSIIQKPSMEVVQASLNSSLRAWQILLGSMAGCWIPAWIMNQRQLRQPLPLSHCKNREDIVCTSPCQCLTPTSPKNSLWAGSTFHCSLSTCPWGCCWRRWAQVPGSESPASPILTLAPTKQHPVFVTLLCSCFYWYFKNTGRVLLTFQIPSADWN